MQIAIPVFAEFTALDVVGPYQVFSFLPGAEVVLCADDPGGIPDDRGSLRLDVGCPLADVPAPDVIVIPGGQITHRMARDGSPVVDWIRAVAPTARWTTSVCTGSLLLGAAGLLDGRPATTHWASMDMLESFGAIPVADRIVESSPVITAAGVSAGIDLALSLAARLASDDVARAIQLGIEYDPQPPFDAGSPTKAPEPVRDVVATMLAESRRTILAR